MNDQTDASDETQESEDSSGDNPFMHVDYRVFEMSIHGGPDDDLEDVNEVMEERLQNALEQIENLKRTDFELDDEYDVERSSSPSGMMTQ